MLKGIDVSNWQAGNAKISTVKTDFIIAKATEGINYVDSLCDIYIQDAIKAKKLWGFYHFAREYTPENEAQYFYKNCKGYIGKGIPVLDYEVWNSNNSHVSWCERFCKKFHELSGIYPVIYMSASNCSRFANSWLPSKCGLWVAGYPSNYTTWVSQDCPYNVNPWPFAAIWQFTDNLKLKGYAGAIDGDLAYMDAKAWGLYATGGKSATTKTKTKTSNDKYKTIVEKIKTLVKDL